MSSLEVGGERYKFAARWTATIYTRRSMPLRQRKACECNNLSPSYGAGIQYVLKPQQGIVANLEYAEGKDGNNAVIFKMGYAW